MGKSVGGVGRWRKGIRDTAARPGTHAPYPRMKRKERKRGEEEHEAKREKGTKTGTREKGDGKAREVLEPRGLSEISFVPNRKKVRRTRLLALVRFLKEPGRRLEE